jgi:sugar phosphate isomerase/epimerase
MRLRHPTGRIVHLGYEITPRPARRVAQVIGQLDTYAAVRAMIGADSLGVSLWLPPALAAALATGARIRTRLRAELDARRLEVVTLSGLSFDEENGSPFAEGGGERSKLSPVRGGERCEISAGRGGERSELSAVRGGERSELSAVGGGERSELSAGRGGERSDGEDECGGERSDGEDECGGERSEGEDDRGGEPTGGEDETRPGWDQPARREYTLDLARVLVDLLPDDAVRGAVGTIGLAPKDHWDEDTAKTGAGILRRLSGGLADIAWQTGRAVRVGFHTATGYVVDSPEETVAALARIDKDRLGVRLDLDHVTRTWDDPVAGLETITDAGLSIIEVRLTAAPGPRLDAWRAALATLLGPDGPQTEYLTLARHVDDPSADQIASDLAYLRAELAALGLAPENEPCPAR